MSNRVFISICIPAYKHVDYLKRLLDSIAIQTFKDFEVIITDDSPGNEVEQFCLQYQSLLPIKYIKNNTSLGSPGNWNACISNASGQWIKKNPVPAKETRWGSFNQLRDFNINAVRAVLENAGANTAAKPGSVEKRVGDYYAAGMDSIVSTQAIEEFALRLKVGTHVLIPQAHHEILQETDEIRQRFWAAFDAYIGPDSLAG